MHIFLTLIYLFDGKIRVVFIDFSHSTTAMNHDHGISTRDTFCKHDSFSFFLIWQSRWVITTVSDTFGMLLPFHSHGQQKCGSFLSFTQHIFHVALQWNKNTDEVFSPSWANFLFRLEIWVWTTILETCQNVCIRRVDLECQIIPCYFYFLVHLSAVLDDNWQEGRR